MSFDEQLAAAHREADTLRDEIKSAIQKLGGAVIEGWSDDDLIKQFRNALNNALRPPAEATAPAGNGKVQAGPMRIEAIEREVAITFSQEERTFKTTGPKGMIMFALVHDLKNEASGESEISAAMVERGWSYPHNTLAPELAKLARDGDLIKEGATRGVRYRVPGKLILTIDGKKVAP